MTERTDPAVGFVIMPFGAASNPFWGAMKESAARYEYLVVQRFGSDGLGHGQGLFPAIRHHIRNATFCVADFTPEENGEHPNLNVLSEAGIAHGAAKQLYLVARGDGYSDVARALPSDWRGEVISLFPTSDNNGQWRGLFKDFFERVLRDLDRPTDLARERPRTTAAQQYQWIIGVVDRVRNECRRLYGEATAGVNWYKPYTKMAGLPNSYTFTLSCDSVPNLMVRVGACFDRWERGSSPLAVEVVAEATETIEVAPGHPGLHSWPTDEAVQSIISTLDGVLKRYTPSMSCPTPLSQIVRRWRDASERLSVVAGAVDGLSGGAQSNWAADGWRLRREVRDTPFVVTVAVDVNLWHEHGRSPYWFVVEPREGQPGDVLTGLNLPWLRAIDGDGVKLIPVPTDGSLESNARKLLTRVIAACRRKAGVRGLPGSGTEVLDSPPDTISQFEDEQTSTDDDSDDPDNGGEASSPPLDA